MVGVVTDSATMVVSAYLHMRLKRATKREADAQAATTAARWPCFAENSDSMQPSEARTQSCSTGGQEGERRMTASLQHAVQLVDRSGLSSMQAAWRTERIEGWHAARIRGMRGIRRSRVEAVRPAEPRWTLRSPLFHREGPKPEFRDDVRNGAGGVGTGSVRPLLPHCRS
jgi:hypothetical protein